jgi:hypothetical protein
MTMTGFKLLLVFSLLSGVFAEQCDITAADMEAFADKVTVTNVSDRAAWVTVAFDRSSSTRGVRAGQTITATSFLSTTFSVTTPDASTFNGYQRRLEEARDTLSGLALGYEATPDQAFAAAVDLLLVVDAMKDLEATGTVGCSGQLEPGVEIHATVQVTTTMDGTTLWSVACG